MAEAIDATNFQDQFRSRRTSCSSNASSISCTTPDYDSGHYSGSNLSDLQLRPISYNSEEDAAQPSSQDIRGIRSELERLTKAERWYKNELRTQKRSKLDLLEKLYLNERKFVRENRKLQADCKRLYELCNEIESKKLDDKDDLVKRLNQLEKAVESSRDSSSLDRTAGSSDTNQLQFELQRHKSIIVENENLIRTLRTQKQSLLDELRTLVNDRDGKMLEIEKRTIILDCENRTITRRCLELVKDKQRLEEHLQASTDDCKELHGVRAQSQRQREEINKLSAALSDLKTSTAAEVSSLQSQLETANSRLKSISEELARQKSSFDEKRLQNEHLEAEIEQYKKMRENFDKYVALLQGNSAELDSKCAEIDHLQSVVSIQTVQLAELSKNSQETKLHWQKVTKDLQEQVDARSQELSLKQQDLADFESKKTSEIQKLRTRLTQLENLNEKLIGQLHGSSSEIVKKSSEIEQLKNVIRELNDLNVENEQLRKLLEAKDDELNQRRVHEVFISELQNEIRGLRSSLDEEKIRGQERTAKLEIESKELEERFREKVDECQTFGQRLHSTEEDRNRIKSELEARIKSLQQTEQANSQLKSTIQSQSAIIESLTTENRQLRGEASQTETLRSELDSCRQLLENYKTENLLLSQASHSNVETEVRKYCRASQTVPELCGFECQTKDDAARIENDAASELRGLRLLQKVMETEHRKQIGRYELHIRTLLGKLRNYREWRCDGGDRSRGSEEYQQRIETLQQQLNVAVRRSSEIDRYKTLNLQLQTNLQSLTDDYKKTLLSASKLPTAPTDYSKLYKLIDDSNSFVPNQSKLIVSIDALKSDIAQLKTVTIQNTTTQGTTIPVNPNLLYPAKRLSLMDELMAADDSFQF